MIQYFFIFMFISNQIFSVEANHQKMIEKSLIDLDFKSPIITKLKYGLLNQTDFTKINFEFDHQKILSDVCGVNERAVKGTFQVEDNGIDVFPSMARARPTTPQMVPCGGSYVKSVSVTLGLALTDTKIYYNTNHNHNFKLYERPIIIKQNTILTTFRLSLEPNQKDRLSNKVFGMFTFPDELMTHIISLKIDKIDNQNITLSTMLNNPANDTMRTQYRWYFSSVFQSTKYSEMKQTLSFHGPLISPSGTYTDLHLQTRIIYHQGETISETQLYKVRFSKDLKTIKLLNIYNQELSFGTWLR